MKRIYYQDGPPSLTAGVAGTFTRGEAKAVEDAVADTLLARTDVRFSEEKKSNKKTLQEEETHV